MTTISNLYYFPNTYFFREFLLNEDFVLEQHENYQKQTFRNRCQILTSQGMVDLSVPILKSENKLYIDTKIDHQQRWAQIHWRSIQTAYGKSPYFEYYSETFEKILLTKNQYLFDFNLNILSKCLKILKIDKKIQLSTNYQPNYDNTIYNDLRNKKLPINSENEYIIKNKIAYYQSFGNEFVDGLSILDLIFYEGTNALKILYNK